MRLRDLVNKGKCLVGLHEGEWRAASLTSCTFTRKCVRCAAEHTRVDHPWGEWHFIADGACEQGRDCVRCALHEQRLQHAFGAAGYVEDGACDRREECQRCHEQRPVAAQHVLTAWRFVNPDECRQVQQCSRCATDGTLTRVEHSWGDWQHSNAHNGSVRVCRRCGELQVQPITAPAPSGASSSSAPAQAHEASPGAEAAPAAPAGAAAKTRQELFDLLKPKMTQLGEQNAVLARVMDELARTLAPAGSTAAPDPAPADHTRTPPIVTDADVADLLARAGGAAPAAAPRTHDHALVAHWRHTSVMSSGGFSLVTDTHLVLQSDGRFRRWTHSASGMGEKTSEALTGSWHTEGDVLHSRSDDGDGGAIGYTVDGSTLFFPEGGSQKLWERVR